MTPRRVRLGDKVDDYCSRCKLVMNHGVMALDGEVILKVQCYTCLSEHPYRHGRSPKKKDPVKAAFDDLLSRMPGVGTKPSGAGRPEAAVEDEEEPEPPDEKN